MTVDEIRTHFPALERTENGRKVAYFDAPGGTQVPRAVGEAMTEYLYHHNANTHWAYPTSEETDAVIAAAREAGADFLNCAPDEVSFGANMTTMTFHLARALGRTWQRGDEVITTELDHHANVAPWHALEVDRGIEVRTARMSVETALIDFDHLERLVTKKTRLIAIGGASNAVGTVSDLGRAREIARAAGALLFVDAVHLAPHELLDVQAIGPDFLACSAYKFYGPHIGMMFVRRDLLAGLPFPKLAPSPDTAPERCETGTLNQEGIAGLRATVDWLASLGGEGGSRRERLARLFHSLHERGSRQARRLWDGLSAIPGVRVYGPPPPLPRTPTVSITLDGHTAEDVARALVESAIFASHGDFYAQTVIERLGVEALLRLGCACYTTDEDVERVIEAVARV